MQDATRAGYEELGTFFFEDEKDVSFSGLVSYGGKSRIILRVISFETKYISDKSIKNLHLICGFLESGKACTLLRPLRISRNIKMNIGNPVTNITEIEFEILILGALWSSIKSVKNICFRPKFFEYFFDSDDTDTRAEQHDEGIISCKIDELIIRIKKIYTLSKVSDLRRRMKKITESGKLSDLENNIFYEDMMNANVLNFIVTDSYTIICIDFLNGIDILHSIEAMYMISSFISLCINKPIHIGEFEIFNNKGNLKSDINVYRNILSDSSVMDNMSREESILSIPINVNNIDIVNCIYNWRNIYKKYKVILDIINFDGRILTLPKLYGEIVVLITFLEDIGISISSRKKKYQHAIERITPPELIMEISNICSSIGYKRNLGKFISDLRAEIVHAEKPKEIIDKIDICQLGRIYYILRLSVQGYILGLSGISKDKINEYIFHYYPYKFMSDANKE